MTGCRVRVKKAGLPTTGTPDLDVDFIEYMYLQTKKVGNSKVIGENGLQSQIL